MTAANEQFRQDINKKPRELEREADEVRADMEHTLDELQQQFSPGEIFNQVYAVLRQNGGDFGANLATQVRNNPVPTLLAGVGLTWLAAASNRPPEPGATSSSGRLSGAAGSASSAAGRVRSGAHSAAATGRDAVDSVRDGARRSAQTAGQAGRDGVRAVRDGYGYLQREQPLVLGALAVAAGALLGSALPSSRVEDEYAGEVSEQARERMQREGKEKLAQARAAGADAAEAASDSLRSGSSDSSNSASRHTGAGNSDARHSAPGNA